MGCEAATCWLERAHPARQERRNNAWMGYAVYPAIADDVLEFVDELFSGWIDECGCESCGEEGSVGS